ncbi:sodium:proton antiporter NhaD [Candidatus Laterigemmans baculatus]|uniref:sodium:proton antiporter NhaD n=1 Tax=Candidatus Laterigemmans baculatus TaxID=2770505 RepID=UPI0013D9599D|nr:sodium:proton antiporter NhaD [Candidatus Laterigemmans baculatus]
MLSAIIVVFILGYLAIALEHRIHINKAASAMLIGVLCWTLYAIDSSNLVRPEMISDAFHEAAQEEGVSDLARAFLVDEQLLRLTGEVAGILFFLMGAMMIVEVVDAHEGFRLITRSVRPTSKLQLLWMVAWLTFFLSAVLDNLTTSIVMVSLLRKIVSDKHDRLMFAGLVVIAANAGGAWTVIGDVTTTMLWIKHRISPVEVMQELFIPSVVCLLAPLLGLSLVMRGPLVPADPAAAPRAEGVKPWQQAVVLGLGVAGLLSVPIFKTWTHLPPFMGMILALSVLWIVSEMIGRTMEEVTRSSTGVLAVLNRIDMASVLFFLGILLAVGSLSATGALGDLAYWLDTVVPNRQYVAVVIGLLSAVVDNVPLVAAGIEMYDLPMDHSFWMLLAFTAGTGGSCLIIGSAAGVAVMGLEHINFVWYLQRITIWALIGYVAGVATFFLQQTLVAM